MSWKTINAILVLALTDEKFCQELLKSPLEAAREQNFELTEKEQAVFKEIAATDLAGFSRQVLSLLAPEEI